MKGYKSFKGILQNHLIMKCSTFGQIQIQMYIPIICDILLIFQYVQ